MHQPGCGSLRTPPEPGAADLTSSCAGKTFAAAHTVAEVLVVELVAIMEATDHFGPRRPQRSTTEITKGGRPRRRPPAGRGRCIETDPVGEGTSAYESVLRQPESSRYGPRCARRAAPVRFLRCLRCFVPEIRYLQDPSRYLSPPLPCREALVARNEYRSQRESGARSTALRRLSTRTERRQPPDRSDSRA